MGIQPVRTNEELHLRQAKYINDLLGRVHLQEKKPITTTMIVGQSMPKTDGTLLENPTWTKQNP